MYKNYPFRIILASASPRRKELLQQLGFSFSIEVKPVDETPNPLLSPVDVALSIVNQKMEAFSMDYFPDNTLVITADTVVAVDDEILGKPSSSFDAKLMLQKLSGRSHQVITAVCLKSAYKTSVFYDTTSVQFSEMTDDEIEFYIQNYHPFDKAGSYGIQEWIGLGFIASINGSYTNVVGLPTEKLRHELMKFASEV